jgi:hypothetical protein
MTFRHTTLCRTPSGRVISPTQKQHTTLKRDKTSMQPAGFEPAIPASERPQTHAIDRAATRTGSRDYGIMKSFVYNNKKVRIRNNCKGKGERAWQRTVTDLPWYLMVVRDFLHVPTAINQAEIHQYSLNRMLDGPRG